MSRLFLVMFLLATSLITTAQERPDRIEAFGGYAFSQYYVYSLYSGPWRRMNFNGWDASAAFKLAPHIAAEADFAGLYSSTTHNTLRTYMGGPHISTDLGRVTVYGHLLFGGLNASGFTAPSATSFALALGGGADIWLNRHIGVRPIQFDYLHNRNDAAAQTGTAGSGSGNNFRITSGIVVRF
jgi:hypothetical protein